MKTPSGLNISQWKLCAHQFCDHIEPFSDTLSLKACFLLQIRYLIYGKCMILEMTVMEQEPKG